MLELGTGDLKSHELCGLGMSLRLAQLRPRLVRKYRCRADREDGTVDVRPGECSSPGKCQIGPWWQS